ncbi:MAG TPA: hypothetical protein ENJ00_00915 [Phycisphaerales bacterium]|nr:hypothetical protein [Phycisphaerales bacterium]
MVATAMKLFIRHCIAARNTWIAAFLVLLATVLLYAGFAKFMHKAAFVESLASQSLIPEPIASQFSWGVILCEIFIACSAVWTITRKRRADHAAMLLSGIFLSFTVYSGALVLHPPPTPVGCGCWGSSDVHPADWTKVFSRNAAASVLLLVMIPAARQTRARCSAD